LSYPPDRPWHRQRWGILGAGFVAAYVSGALIAVVVRSQGDWNAGAAWERSIMTAMNTPLWPPIDFLMLVFPWFGTNLTLMPVIGGIVLWLWAVKKRTHLAMWLLIVQLGSWALNPMLKYSFERIRPDLFPKRGWFGWASYPSGHAIASIAVLFTLAIMAHKELGWKWPYVVVGVIAGGSLYSRVYLAVHWPSDVIAGVVVGAIWLWAVYKSFNELPVVTPTGLPRSRPDA
jgi:membrane-associated phospholipid phosphatase